MLAPSKNKWPAGNGKDGEHRTLPRNLFQDSRLRWVSLQLPTFATHEFPFLHFSQFPADRCLYVEYGGHGQVGTAGAAA